MRTRAPRFPRNMGSESDTESDDQAEKVSTDLRRRGGHDEETPAEEDIPAQKIQKKTQEKTSTDTDVVDPNVKLETGTYWLTRIVMLRLLAFVYFVAFLVAFEQNNALFGSRGLLPANSFMQMNEFQLKGISMGTIKQVPTLLWFFNYEDYIDPLLQHMATLGLVLSGVVFICGCSNMIMMLFIWALYQSIVNVGQIWYSFGWESQLLETGFLAAFLCPIYSFRQLPRGTPTSRIVRWAFRWLIFRIMLGAGLIKLRGDKCWRNLTCMNYHYETQPVPNPIAYYLHQTPELFHQFEVLTNHFVELVVPWFLIVPMPRRISIIAGFIQVLFQVVLMLSGNLSFLNMLTIVPCLSCFDDASLAWMFPSGWRIFRYFVPKRWVSNKINVYHIQQEDKVGISPRGSDVRRMINLALAALIFYLSVPVVQNMWSSEQIMDTSYDPLKIVNTYGAFGSMTKIRTEVSIQGTYDHPSEPDAEWYEYQFKCKPGRLKRRPCFLGPYHYRLDWQMWFAAFQDFNYNNWLVHVAAKLMVNDPEMLALLDFNPFKGKDPPRWIRGIHYRYSFTKFGSKAARQGKWWERKYIGLYFQPLALEYLTDYLKQMGWPIPRIPD